MVTVSYQSFNNSDLIIFARRLINLPFRLFVILGTWTDVYCNTARCNNNYCRRIYNRRTREMSHGKSGRWNWHPIINLFTRARARALCPCRQPDSTSSPSCLLLTHISFYILNACCFIRILQNPLDCALYHWF